MGLLTPFLICPPSKSLNKGSTRAPIQTPFWRLMCSDSHSIRPPFPTHPPQRKGDIHSYAASTTSERINGDIIWVFPKIMVSQIIHFNRVFHCKPSILGYPYLWKHPYYNIIQYQSPTCGCPINLSINQSINVTRRRFQSSWTNISQMGSVPKVGVKNKQKQMKPPPILPILSGFWNI